MATDTGPATPIVHPGTPGGLAPCYLEDGSTNALDEFPCVWDAPNVGNGQGCAFVLDFVGDVPHYITGSGPQGEVYTDDAGCTPVVVDTVPVADVVPVTASEPVAEVGTAVTPSLAETGMDGSMGSGIALVLIIVGVAFVRLRARSRA